MPYALEILTSGRGSGGRIDSPFYVDHVHPILVSSVERAVVSLLFKSQDWTPVERLYHNKGQVFEWRIKLTSGDVVPVFFDISQVNDLAPVSDAVRQEFNQRSHTVPVPDATLISRFPLSRSRRGVQLKRQISSLIILSVPSDRDGRSRMLWSWRTAGGTTTTSPVEAKRQK